MKSVEPPTLASRSRPNDRAELIVGALPLRRGARIQDFRPGDGCRRLDPGVHATEAWEWICAVAGPMPTLPPALQRTVLRYTGDHYHEINQAMVNGTGSRRAMAWAEQMREALALIHLPVALRLYRSSSPRWLHQKREHFAADHLISTSPDPRVATAWTPAMPYPRRTLWAIDAPQGAHAIWGTPNNRHQAEVLLAEGTRFSVIEVLRNCRGDALMHLALAQGEQRRE